MEKRYLKVTIVILTAVIYTLSLFSCQKEPPTVTPESTTEPETTIQLGCGDNHNFVDGYCTECGKQEKVEAVESLEYTLSEDGSYYTVSGIGTVKNTEITVPAYYEGKPVKAVSDGAFKDQTHITAINLPDSVEMIGKDAFRGCTELTAFTVPRSLKTVGDGAFADCKIERVEIGSFFSWCGIDFESLSSNPMYNGAILTMNGEPVTNAHFDNESATIKNYTFAGCKSLSVIRLPSELTEIGDGAFYRCTELSSLTIPKKVTRIGSYAFYGCSGITSLTSDGGALTVGDNAFAECVSLKKAAFTEGLDAIGENAFLKNSSLTSLSLPKSLKSIGEFALGFCTELSEITFYGTVGEWESIEKQNTWNILTPVYKTVCSDGNVEKKEPAASPELIFRSYLEYCSVSGLSKDTGTPIIIPSLYDGKPLEHIDHSAFSNCHNLTEIYFPTSIKSIGYGAFMNASHLRNIFLPSSLMDISSTAFMYCTSLEEIDIPEGITWINESTFEECSSLSTVYLPSSLTVIAKKAFSGCVALKTIYFAGTKEQWQNIYTDTLWDAGTPDYTIFCTNGIIEVKH